MCFPGSSFLQKHFAASSLMNLIRSCPNFLRKLDSLNARSCDRDCNKRLSPARKSVTLLIHHLQSPRTALLSSVRVRRTQRGELAKLLPPPAQSRTTFIHCQRNRPFFKKAASAAPSSSGRDLGTRAGRGECSALAQIAPREYSRLNSAHFIITPHITMHMSERCRGCALERHDNDRQL